jgi:hypothetical protein
MMSVSVSQQLGEDDPDKEKTQDLKRQRSERSWEIDNIRQNLPRDRTL